MAHNSRGRSKLFKAGAWLSALALASCAAGEADIDAYYAQEDCRRIALTDAVRGEAIGGVEDMALDRAAGVLYLTAYDRRAAERAAKTRADVIPEGGVYAVRFEALVNAGEAGLRLKPLIGPGEAQGGVRPHGLSFDQNAGELVFVNRSYTREGRKWRMTARLERAGADGAVFVGFDGAAPCAANDLIADEHGLLVSFDHRACDWRGGFEDVFSLKMSGVSARGERVFGAARFANGLVRLSPSQIALAATREQAVLVLEHAGADEAQRADEAERADEAQHADEPKRKWRVAKRLQTPGGPDNLTRSDDGALIAGVHPALMRLGAHRKLGIGKAPSRIVKIDPESGASAVLYDDPSGAQFTAATVGVQNDGALVIGSVTDKGVLVCGKEPA